MSLGPHGWGWRSGSENRFARSRCRWGMGRSAASPPHILFFWNLGPQHVLSLDFVQDSVSPPGPTPKGALHVVGAPQNAQALT